MIPIFKTCIFLGCVIVSLLLLNNTATAQGKWKPGYIITANGDTVYGSVAYRENQKTPQIIAFKKQHDQNVQHYGPADIRACKVMLPSQDIFLKSFTTELERSPTDLALIDNNPIPALKEYTFFAKLLVAGDKSLYTFIDKTYKKTHFLIEYPKGKITDLITKRYYLYSDMTDAIYTDNYKKQLREYYTGCATLDTQTINRVNYNTYSMMKLATRYNDCNTADTSLNYRYKLEQSKASIGIVAGVNNCQLYVTDPAILRDVNFKKVNNFIGGLFFNFTMPSTDHRLSFFAEMLFMNYNAIANVDYAGSSYNSQFNIKYTNLDLITGMRYKFPLKNISPFLTLAALNSFVMNYSSSQSIVGPNSIDLINPAIPFHRDHLSCLMGAGISWKRYELEIGYQQGAKYAEDPYPSKMTNYSLLVRYHIF